VLVCPVNITYDPVKTRQREWETKKRRLQIDALVTDHELGKHRFFKKRAGYACVVLSPPLKLSWRVCLHVIRMSVKCARALVCVSCSSD
jgi:hypothetical protein